MLIWGSIAGGAVGATVLASGLRIAQEIGWTRMDLPFLLGTIFTESNKPYEVELVVAEVAEKPEGDQIYRITFDGSVTDEP